MQLSHRLTTVAEFVTKGNRVADIGCDHAHTSIYLVENGIAVSSIAMDVNKGPLERAKENIRRFGYEDKITTRLSDGAKELVPGEVDTLLISGMGGLLMNKILSESIEVVKAAKELILQPQSEIALVRKYIHELGFCIEDEVMLVEDEKYYVAIKAKNVYKTENYNKEIDYRYGKVLLDKKCPVLEQFLKNGKASYEKIVADISGSESEKTRERCKELQEELIFIGEALKEYCSCF